MTPEQIEGKKAFYRSRSVAILRSIQRRLEADIAKCEAEITESAENLWWIGVELKKRQVEINREWEKILNGFK